MTKVVENYGETMAQMIESQNAQKTDVSSKAAQLQAQATQLQQEKAQVESDLNKTEAAFSDLHRKYEKLKEILGKSCRSSC